MKKIACFILLLLLIFTLFGCETTGGNLEVTSSNTSNDTPSDFAIYYSDWIVNKNILDTYEGYIQKDLIENGVDRVDYDISDDILQSIYDKIIELDLCSIDKEMTSANLTTSDKIYGVEPCTHYEIKFTINGKIYTITGDETANSHKNNENAKSFCEFISFMRQIIISTDEYKSLPEAQGGYQ